jgi:hypothetical protein
LDRGRDLIIDNRMNRGDLGTAPIYIIGGIVFVIGLFIIFGTTSHDIGLIATGMGLVLIGINDKPEVNFHLVKYTGPPGLFLIVWGGPIIYYSMTFKIIGPRIISSGIP